MYLLHVGHVVTRDDACTALYNGLPKIKKALEELIEDRFQKSIV